jgi:hypothetical protein
MKKTPVIVYNSDARRPGFDSHPDPGRHFNGKTLISLLSDLKKISFICNIGL